MGFNLHGSVGDGASGYAFNQLRASIAVIFGDSLYSTSDYSSLIYEATDPADVMGNETVFITTGIDQDIPGVITFDVTNNTDFYVVASMSASSINGFADASNTLSLQFQDDSGLSAATVSAVPLPAAAWLFGSALLGLGVIKRRKA